MVPEQASQQAFFGVSALLFAASAAVTIVWCASISAMGEMPMPGAWMMSMAWMRMPGQTWPGAAASFLGMWVVMMVAMMLPSLVPMLWRYRQAVCRTGETRLGRLTALVGVGYFFVWTMFGMAAFPLGVALAAIEMQQPALARAVPIAVGVVVLIAGSLQLTAWKVRHLACCQRRTKLSLFRRCRCPSFNELFIYRARHDCWLHWEATQCLARTISLNRGRARRYSPEPAD
jgi:predicted metal-binding membrane protein